MEPLQTSKRCEYLQNAVTQQWCEMEEARPEFVAQCWLSMYYSSRDIQSLTATATLLSRLSPDSRNNMKSIRLSLCECSIKYGRLKASLHHTSTRMNTVQENLSIDLRCIIYAGSESMKNTSEMQMPL